MEEHKVICNFCDNEQDMDTKYLARDHEFIYPEEWTKMSKYDCCPKCQKKVIKSLKGGK